MQIEVIPVIQGLSNSSVFNITNPIPRCLFLIACFVFSCRDFCQHLHLQPGGHCHRAIQRHLQPSEVPIMADAVTRLPCHHRHLGAVTANHGALPGLQHPQVFPQGQQHRRSHVPPGLAQPTSWADLVSVRQRFHLPRSLNSSSSSSRSSFTFSACISRDEERWFVI